MEIQNIESPTPPLPPESRSIGQIGYDAYRDHTGGISLASGGPIPEWNGLKPEIKQAWEVAAQHIAASVGRADAR